MEINSTTLPDIGEGVELAQKPVAPFICTPANNVL